MRLFVGVDLPSELTATVESVQDKLGGASGLRLTDPTQAHVTLKFLGDTDPERIEEIETAIQTAVQDAAVEPFDCTIDGLGVFPSLEYISVIWAGVREGSGAVELTQLHEALEDELTALGFEAEHHAFTPHVTLARMDDGRGESVVQDVLEESDPTVGTFRVTSIELTESTLTDAGPEYETVSEVDL